MSRAQLSANSLVWHPQRRELVPGDSQSYQPLTATVAAPMTASTAASAAAPVGGQMGGQMGAMGGAMAGQMAPMSHHSSNQQQHIFQMQDSSQIQQMQRLQQLQQQMQRQQQIQHKCNSNNRCNNCNNNEIDLCSCSSHTVNFVQFCRYSADLDNPCTWDEKSGCQKRLIIIGGSVGNETNFYEIIFSRKHKKVNIESFRSDYNKLNADLTVIGVPTASYVHSLITHDNKYIIIIDGLTGYNVYDIKNDCWLLLMNNTTIKYNNKNSKCLFINDKFIVILDNFCFNLYHLQNDYKHATLLKKYEFFENPLIVNKNPTAQAMCLVDCRVRKTTVLTKILVLCEDDILMFEISMDDHEKDSKNYSYVKFRGVQNIESKYLKIVNVGTANFNQHKDKLENFSIEYMRENNNLQNVIICIVGGTQCQGKLILFYNVLDNEIIARKVECF